MDAIQPHNHSGPASAARTADDLGTIVRAIRLAKGLTLAQVATRCGYSVSALSRMERGKQPLRDVRVIRILAAALDVNPMVFGQFGTHRGYESTTTRGTMVEVTQAPAKETDPMRRRTLLTGLTGVAGTAVLGAPPTFAEPDGPLRGFVDALLNPPDLIGAPPTLERLRQQVAAAYATFHRGHYLAVATSLPDLVSAALAARAEQDAGIDIAAADPPTSMCWAAS